MQPPLSPRTQSQYRRYLKTARTAWGELAVGGLEPVHVREMMDKLGATSPATANAFLIAMQALNKWARARNHVRRSMVEDVRAFPTTGGHKPWTAAQTAVAMEKLTGTLRQGFMLYYFTGQRGSDVMKLGPTHIDDGGFAITQNKTKRDVWVPIMPELAAAMATWEKRPGPFLRTATGKNYSRARFGREFQAAIADIPELAGVTLHGLRCTAAIRLRDAGLEVPQISNIMGMSMPTIERYCRFADKKASGKAALIKLSDRERMNSNAVRTDR